MADLGISGYFSAAPVSYPNARYIYTFVNGRYVRDKVLTHALIQGYDTLLMKGQYPAVVLFLEIPYGEVDVNVHPAKYEVRFRRQSDVHGLVARAIRGALQERAKEPSASHSFTAQRREISLVMESPLPYAQHSGGASLSSFGAREPFSLPLQTDALPNGFFSSMTVLGQIFGCYLVCASTQGLSLIDQHAAHERVAFEKLRRQLNDGLKWSNKAC